MITKRMCSRILLCSASTLLVRAMAVAQYQPGGAGQQQQPNMPNQQPVTPSTGTMGPDSSLANQQAMADQAFVRKARSKAALRRCNWGNSHSKSRKARMLSNLGRRWWKTTRNLLSR
jgi:hypothetical protein